MASPATFDRARREWIDWYVRTGKVADAAVLGWRLLPPGVSHGRAKAAALRIQRAVRSRLAWRLMLLTACERIATSQLAAPRGYGALHGSPLRPLLPRDTLSPSYTRSCYSTANSSRGEPIAPALSAPRPHAPALTPPSLPKPPPFVPTDGYREESLSVPNAPAYSLAAAPNDQPTPPRPQPPSEKFLHRRRSSLGAARVRGCAAVLQPLSAAVASLRTALPLTAVGALIAAVFTTCVAPMGEDPAPGFRYEYAGTLRLNAGALLLLTACLLPMLRAAWAVRLLIGGWPVLLVWSLPQLSAAQDMASPLWMLGTPYGVLAVADEAAASGAACAYAASPYGMPSLAAYCASARAMGALCASLTPTMLWMVGQPHRWHQRATETQRVPHGAAAEMPRAAAWSVCALFGWLGLTAWSLTHPALQPHAPTVDALFSLLASALLALTLTRQGLPARLIASLSLKHRAATDASPFDSRSVPSPPPPLLVDASVAALWVVSAGMLGHLVWHLTDRHAATGLWLRLLQNSMLSLVSLHVALLDHAQGSMQGQLPVTPSERGVGSAAGERDAGERGSSDGQPPVESMAPTLLPALLLLLSLPWLASIGLAQWPPLSPFGQPPFPVASVSAYISSAPITAAYVLTLVLALQLSFKLLAMPWPWPLSLSPSLASLGRTTLLLCWCLQAVCLAVPYDWQPLTHLAARHLFSAAAVVHFGALTALLFGVGQPNAPSPTCHICHIVVAGGAAAALASSAILGYTTVTTRVLHLPWPGAPSTANALWLAEIGALGALLSAAPLIATITQERAAQASVADSARPSAVAAERDENAVTGTAADPVVRRLAMV